MAADVTADEPAVAAHGTADDTQVDPPGGARKRRRARPHKARVARRLGMRDGNAPPNPGMEMFDSLIVAHLRGGQCETQARLLHAEGGGALISAVISG